MNPIHNMVAVKVANDFYFHGCLRCGAYSAREAKHGAGEVMRMAQVK